MTARRPAIKPATLAQLRRESARHGADLEVDRQWDSITVTVDAPDGKVWRATGGTILCAFTYLGTAGWVAECYGDVVDRMKDGLRDRTPDDQVDA